MVEAGAMNVPVLYMVNPNFNEPVTKAIQLLINSYYQGSTCTDMINFLKNCKKNWDPNSNARKKAFNSCIPMYDGRAGERIKEDVIKGVINNQD